MFDAGLFGATQALTVIEYILRIFAYIAFIGVSFKGAQALTIYIRKNMK